MKASERFLFIAVLTVVMLLGTAAAAYAGSIGGTVSGAGAPLANDVYVTLYRADGSWVSGQYIGAGGTYEFAGVADDSYIVFADPSWYNEVNGTYFLMQYYSLADSWSDATEVTVSGDVVSGIDFDLVAGGALSGIVSGGGNPLADNIEVDFYDEFGSWIGYDYTDATGVYESPALPVGAVYVQFWAGSYNYVNDTDFIGEFYQDVRTLEEATALTITLNDVTTLDVELAVGGRIAGTVTGGGGPLATDVLVYLYETNGDNAGSCWTDGSGQYVFRGLYAGDYVVVFEPSSYNEINGTEYLDEFYDNARDWDSAALVTATPGAPTLGVDADLEVGGSISGTVMGDGSPVGAGVAVVAYDEYGNWIAGDETDADGAYRITTLQAGAYRVLFDANGYNSTNGTSFLSQYYDGVRDWDSATPVSVELATDTSNIDADLPLGGTITGSVTGDGTPLEEGVEVQVYDAQTGDYAGAGYVGAGGAYIVNGLYAGDYLVFFEPGSYNSDFGADLLGEWYDDARYQADATPVTVAQSQETSGINADLASGGAITGTVTGDGGPLADDVDVNVYDSATGDWIGSAWTRGDGTYSISPLYPGEYTLFFDADDYNSINGTSFLDQWYDGVRYQADATPVSVAAGVDTTGIDVDLPVGGTISGMVTGDGGPLADTVRVIAYDAVTSDWIASAYTDGTGSYQIKGLYAGDYRVYFDVDEYNYTNSTSFVGEWYDDAHLEQDATVVSVSQATVTSGVDADLAIGGIITGTVTGDGMDLAEINVVVFDAVTGDWLGDVWTDSDGTYAVRGLYPGDCKVRFDPGYLNWMNDTAFLQEYYDNQRYYEDATPVTVDFGTVATSIDADLEIGGSISGTVSGDGSPVGEGLSIQVYEASTGNWMGSASTQSDGTYSVTPLYSGEYLLEFSAGEYNYYNATGFVSEWYDDVRLYSDATPVAVEVGLDTPGIDADLAVGGTISGTVTGDGDVLEGVDVYAYDVLTGEYGGDVYTEADGTYSIRGLWSGDFNVGFFPNEHNYDNGTAFMDEFYSNVRDWEDATPVAVVLGDDTPDIDADLEIGAILSGTVTGDGGAPLGDVIVSLRDTYGRYIDDTWCDDTGAWAFRGVAPGDYLLDFDTSYVNDWHHQSYVREYWNDAATFADADTISVDFGDVMDGLDAQLVQGGAHITGTVYDSDGVTPLHDIGVGVIEDLGGEAIWLSWTYTDIDGTYDVGALPSGELYVDFWDDAGVYKEMFYPAAPWGDYDELVFADPVTVPAAGTVSGIDGVLIKPAKLFGSVVDTQAVGIGGIDVDLWYDGGDKGWHAVHEHTTGIAGDFDFTGSWCGLLPGTYKVRFTDSTGDLGEAWYLNSPDAQDATTFTVDAAGEYTLDPQLLPLLSSSVDVLPIAGSNRINTAIAASQEAFPAGAGTVVIATGYNWPDALGGAALAGAVDGPVLLTDSKTLPAEVSAEVTRLGASKAYILGGTSAVSSTVENSLKTLLGATNVVRLSGSNRYVTAAIVASQTVDILGPDFDGTAFVATGANFPDALGASPLAAAQGWPIYLVNPTTGADAALVTAMQSAGVDKILPLGGTAVISAAIENNLKAQLPCTSTRLSGANRYATALAVAEYGVTEAGMVWNRVAIATGQNFPDALAGGVLQGNSNSVMLLTQSTVLYPDIATTLAANKSKIWEVRFLGGTSAVSAAVRASVTNALATP